MEETGKLISEWFLWKARSGRPFSDRTRARYSEPLRRLASTEGSLLGVTREDLQDYADRRRTLSNTTVRTDQYAFKSFFGFAVAQGLRADDPSEGLAFVAEEPKTRSRARLWAGMPRRELLPERYWPLFDFLRETWGRHPELTGDDLRSIQVRGRVPDVVKLRSRKRQGQTIALSAKARIGLEAMGGKIPITWGNVERLFRVAFGGAFPPSALKDMPPVGFGIDMHEAFEGNIREQVTAGQMEDAARAAFVELEDRMRRMVRQVTGKDIHPVHDIVNLLFGDSGPLASSLSAKQREPLRMLILGAFGVFRNLVDHRTDVFPSEAHGVDVILLADLAMRLLDPIEKGLIKRP